MIESLDTEYARLAREKEVLQHRLEDFEMLMGDRDKEEK